MNDKKLYMIGNAHLDPVWLWQWQEGFQEIKATFRSALDRMNEYPEFVFTSSSAAYYEWIEHNDPAMFEEIKRRVAEGRWQIVGGWWVEPDANLPSGESFVRQALYGQRYFRDKLGVTARTGYSVDSFGHAGTLPQILKKSGLDYYVFLRPGAHEKGLSAPLFRWESDDGSQVLAFRIPYEYCTSGEDIEKHVRRCAAELKSPLNRVMCFYGVGNHGGGPTRKNIESIRRLRECADLPELVFSSPDRFFADVESDNANLPVVHHDLQNHARGCYSAHSAVKRWNRQAENLLATAEKFASIAARVTGQPYPAADLRQAWKAVLFNQFHDILAGTSIEAAYEDARNGYGEAAGLASRALNHAVQSLAWNIRIAPEEGSQPLVVFSPHAWQSKTNVELEFGKWSDGNRLVDDGGHNVPVQLAQPQGSAKERSRLCFVADLPPLGYRLYRVTSTPVPERRQGTELPLIATDATLENEYLRLEIDPLSGCIGSLYDKRANVQVFEREAARAVVLQDESDTWSHNTFRYDCPAGEFRPRRVRLVEHGPVRAVIRVESEYGASLLVQDFTLYRELDQVDVR
ncbi:MAG: alpha-mannosidase, partial [Rudaea sp.]